MPTITGKDALTALVNGELLTGHTPNGSGATGGTWTPGVDSNYVSPVGPTAGGGFHQATSGKAGSSYLNGSTMSGSIYAQIIDQFPSDLGYSGVSLVIDGITAGGHGYTFARSAGGPWNLYLDGGASTFATANPTFATATPYTIKITRDVVAGNAVLNCYINNTLVIGPFTHSTSPYVGSMFGGIFGFDVSADFSTFECGISSSPVAAGTLATGVIAGGSIGFTGGTVSGGTAPYSSQLQRVPAGAGFGSPTAIGSPVVGTTPVFADTTAVLGTSYDYRYVVTDNVAGTANSSTVSSVVGPVGVSNANLKFFGFDVNANVDATANHGGPYLKVNFTGTSVRVNVNPGPLSGGSVASNRYPFIRVSVDGGPFVDTQLASGVYSIPATTGLSAGTHTLYVVILAADMYTVTNYDRWGPSPINCAKITSLTLDAGAASAAPTLRPGRIIVFGDSITEGGRDLSISDLPAVGTDSYATWAQTLARALNSEVEIVAYGGAGWTTTGTGNIPVLGTFYSLYSSGRTRLSGGVYPVTYDRAYINSSTNDGTASIAAAVAAALPNVRTALGNATKLYVLVPFGGFERANLTAAVASYLSGSGDSKTHLMDLGTANQSGLTAFGAATAESTDGLHPTLATHATLGAAVAAATGTAEGGGGTTISGAPGLVLANSYVLIE